MTYLEETLSDFSSKNSKLVAKCKYISGSEQIILSWFKYHVIRFSQPWVLNDPVEANPGIVLTCSDEKINYTHYTYQGIRLPSYKDQIYLNLVEARYNRFGILSLSKNLFSYRMWNSYANAHKGFIVDFRQNINEPKVFKSAGLFSGLVKYVEKNDIVVDQPIGPAGYTTYDYLNRELFLKKTSHWKDEQEYRIIRPLAEHPDYQAPIESKPYRDERLYLFEYDPSSIASIVFGAAMLAEKKKTIFELTKDLDIVYLQSVVDKSDNFALYYLPVTFWKSREIFLSQTHHVFITDGDEFKYRDLEKKIRNLEEIPYFQHPIVEHMLTSFILRRQERNKKEL